MKTSIHIANRKIPLWAVGLGFVVLGLLAYSPYFYSGFAADDFIFINMMEGAIPYNPWQGFWSVPVGDYQGFTQLWWVSAESGGAFLRPLASWTLTALYNVFGRTAFPFHVTSALVHSLGAFAAFLVLRRLSKRGIPSLLAAFLFLICEDHGMTVAWIATITDLLCALFLNLAVWSHIRAREDREPWRFTLSLLFFLAAFASKETAAIYPVIIVVYEFFFVDRLGDKLGKISFWERMRLFLRDWWAWTVPLLVFAAYMTFYRGLFPPVTSLMYVDPFTQPGRYLARALPNLPVMFVALLTQYLPSIVMMIPASLPFVAVFGVILVILLIWALLPYRSERSIWFALAIFTLSILPGLATEPGERLLYFPSVYGLFVVSWLILRIPRLGQLLTFGDAQPGPASPPPAPKLSRIWGWYLLVSALILPLALLIIYPFMWIPSMQWPEQTVVESLPLIDAGIHQHAVYLNTNSSYNTFYLPDIYRYHRGEYVDLRVLSSFNGRVSAWREGTNIILLRTEDTGWLSNMFARLVRTEPEFSVGDIYNTELFNVTILKTTPTSEDVLEARFEFKIPLDDPALALIY